MSSKPFSILSYNFALSIVLTIWTTCVVIVILIYTHKNGSTYIRFGPGDNVKIMQFPVASWHVWSYVFVSILFSQSLYIISTEMIRPWILNILMDPKSRDLGGYSYSQVQFMCFSYYTFAAVIQMFQVQAVMAQADFACTILGADLFISFITTHFFICEKNLHKEDVSAHNIDCSKHGLLEEEGKK